MNMGATFSFFLKHKTILKIHSTNFIVNITMNLNLMLNVDFNINQLNNRSQFRRVKANFQTFFLLLILIQIMLKAKIEEFFK